jgi:hypothetical protein
MEEEKKEEKNRKERERERERESGGASEPKLLVGSQTNITNNDGGVHCTPVTTATAAEKKVHWTPTPETVYRKSVATSALRENFLKIGN